MMKALLIYPGDFTTDKKELELTDVEVQVLLASKKVGSESKYFLINEIIFEDTPEGHSISVILENP